MTIDRFDPTPIYRQLADIIVRMIMSGELAPRDPIPSESVMVSEYGVARDTARAAVKWLRDQGWVFTLPQRGSYVSPPEKWPSQSRDGWRRDGD
jgi:GntR family transcriptional regulator